MTHPLSAPARIMAKYPSATPAQYHLPFLYHQQCLYRPQVCYQSYRKWEAIFCFVSLVMSVEVLLTFKVPSQFLS